MLKTVVASACCCGIVCRWHGRRVPKSRILRELEATGVAVVPVCPEMLAGMGCPRPPLKSKRRRIYETDVETRSTLGPERTADLERGAAAAVGIALAHGAEVAYLQRSSPSCAPTGVAGRAFRAAGFAVVPIW
jgi:purine-nucleoside phosphorylase